MDMKIDRCEQEFNSVVSSITDAPECFVWLPNKKSIFPIVSSDARLLVKDKKYIKNFVKEVNVKNCLAVKHCIEMTNQISYTKMFFFAHILKYNKFRIQQTVIHELCHVVADYLEDTYGFDVDDKRFVKKFYRKNKRYGDLIRLAEETLKNDYKKYHSLRQEKFCCLMDLILTPSRLNVKPNKSCESLMIKVDSGKFELDDVLDLTAAAWFDIKSLGLVEGWIPLENFRPV